MFPEHTRRRSSLIALAAIIGCWLPGRAGHAETCTVLDPKDCSDSARLILKSGRNPENDARARALYERACGFDDHAGCIGLAKFLAAGDGGDADGSRATKLLKRECAIFPADLSGQLNPCLDLANLLLQGPNEVRDEAKGFPLFFAVCSSPDCEAGRQLVAQRCDSGDAIACDQRGRDLRDNSAEKGEGPMQKAVELFDRSCKAGAEQGCIDLAVAMAGGDGTAKDSNKAFSQLKELCAHGTGRACGTLAGLAPRNAWAVEKGDTLLSRACEAGDGRSCIELARADDALLINATARRVELYLRAADEDGSQAEHAAAELAKTCSLPTLDGCTTSKLIVDKACRQEPGCQRMRDAIDVGCRASGNNCWLMPALELDGIGVAKEQVGALSKLKAQCGQSDKGNVLADSAPCLVLAHADANAARPYLKALCERKDKDACTGLGLLELRGQGGKSDAHDAVRHFGEACNNNGIEGCFELVHAACPTVESPSCTASADKGGFSILRSACQSRRCDNLKAGPSYFYAPLGREWMMPYLHKKCDATYQAACAKILSSK